MCDRRLDVNESEKARDPKDMTASELLRKAGNGYEGASGTVMTNLIDLMGLSRKIRHSECFYDLADKIDAELAQDRKEAVEESKKPMWWFRDAIERGEDWPEPREGESFRHYLDRCFLPRPRFEDGEPVQFGDSPVGLDGVEKFIFVRSCGGSCQMQDADGNMLTVFPGDRVKRPAPEVLGADGKPIKVGETVYPIDGEYGRVASVGGCGCCGSPWLVTESGYDVHSLSASGDGASVWCAGEEIPDER